MLFNNIKKVFPLPSPHQNDIKLYNGPEIEVSLKPSTLYMIYRICHELTVEIKLY